ncbi:MAG: Flp family type IVb pilin [bacterium]|nr:Flp family type IVb pilin [bacterium]
MRRLLSRFLFDEKGQGMVEYGLIIALIAVVIIAVFIFLGPTIKRIFVKGAGDKAVETGMSDVKTATEAAQ